jgi:hypothetical protein
MGPGYGAHAGRSPRTNDLESFIGALLSSPLIGAQSACGERTESLTNSPAPEGQRYGDAGYALMHLINMALKRLTSIASTTRTLHLLVCGTC